FPVPHTRVVLKEISVVWHLYGGKDFGGKPMSIHAQNSNRCSFLGFTLNVLQVSFQHESYPVAVAGQDGEGSLTAGVGPSGEQPLSRQVFIVQELEVRDRLASSQLNKFLYLYTSESMPRRAHSNMLTVKALQILPESGLGGPECCLRVSLLPLRLNIDQKLRCYISTISSDSPTVLHFVSQGTFAGILIGLAQLNCSELKLKRLCCRHGYKRTFRYLHGVRDLFWLPIEQYRKDGRIIRGLQRGAASFGTSTASAALELSNRLVQAIQATAETVYDILSPTPPLNRYAITEGRAPSSRPRRAAQPADLREGVAKAYDTGVIDTAQTLCDVASRGHEQKGFPGAVGGVLRQIPPTVVRPLILASEATSNVLGGMRNQIKPDARKEDFLKWRTEDAQE
ncbi:hypothetical protein GOODEAATRI_008096, partial [Goodea atripinnis]